MPSSLSRRDFLRSAGGITFLALTPIGRGLFAATPGQGTGLPQFTAVPYIQPGNSSLLVEGKEEMVVAWQTENKMAEFGLEYGLTREYGKKAMVTYATRLSGSETRLNYAGHLNDLPLGQKVFYKVTGNGQTIAEGFTTTRQPRGTRTRFVALGDNACSNVGNRNVAYQAYLTNPDFVVNVGDSVYNRGLDSEYTKYFFMVFNSDVAEAGVGAPLLRSVPYYAVLGNHDVYFGKSTADFDVDSGALGYYTNMYLPGNGHKTPPSPTPIKGAAPKLSAFRQAAGSRYPKMANYSFDHGDIHFLCLDSNIYVDPTNADLQKWIADDLQKTSAAWKFVMYHHPAFNVGAGHYTEQHMRALCPLLERQGVDFVLSGHEHVYQRCMPMRFAPTDLTKAAKVHSGDRFVPGNFTIDRQFDGQKITKPEGIFYITTGAGGQVLYDSKMHNNPPSWLHDEDDRADYVTRFISDRHSFTLFDVNDKEVTMKQIDEFGAEIDRILVTRA